jgi:hypothetical protein
MNRPDHEIDAYLEGELTAEQARALEAWINASPDNAAVFLHLVHTHQMLGTLGKEQRLASKAKEANPEDLDPVTLHALAEMEAAAEPVPFSEVEQPFSFDDVKPKHKPQKSADLAHAIDDLRWALGKSSLRLIRSTPFITGSIAAILILGLYLFAPFGSTDPAPPQDIADNTAPKPAESAQPILRDQTVATLTAEHDAIWDRRPGEDLYAGQRLTLTAGFAEITTARGAVAILEGPCVVELMGNGHALRLHSGKLVGICETEASKGFVVRTPYMDITDLGTRFGVNISPENGVTNVHVFDGAVAVSSQTLDDGLNPAQLIAGQSVSFSHENRELTVGQMDAAAFSAINSRTLRLAGTGIGIEESLPDENWIIVAIDGVLLDEPFVPWVSNFADHKNKRYIDPTSAVWLAFVDTSDERPPLGMVRYTFQTQIEVPADIELDRATLIAHCFVDNDLISVSVNGKNVTDFSALSMAIGETPRRDWAVPSSAGLLRHGTNTIEIELANLATTPMGLLMSWELVEQSISMEPVDEK